ncbi:anhydro-N-acetylmuramic acid kinase [Ancylobacter defluvii]|uniref:Anhydro-N-acetylmuramic acid kinase n=1 Tax=Ancylobacter defluvii TaxID=1282440 RepID=A0A9W6JST9_9HYPH|nr:anhydro-N-acetylmuramic acid kinase [Ancylobacter defluvii]MBS7587817.1 anhydro-N-acetylmuramic acid kinase [Ancylobacter defluvii]GLK82627.1 anhydro-N-acetylmuramic acid kinase [Ancylobacter defluvii]
MAESVVAIGLMSGTSLDGIDVALIETDGESIAAFGPSATYPYRTEDRALLVRAIEEAKMLADRTARPGVLAEAELMLTARHGEAVVRFVATHPQAAKAQVVGFHGQTVLHRPEIALTVQIGDGPVLARALRAAGLKPGGELVYDLRAADVAAGGQGAPLVPVYHAALAKGLVDRLGLPVLFLNLGGVANVTYIDGINDPIAFDTGPANALIDDFMKERTGLPVDADGACAAAGHVDEAALSRLLAHPFFAQRPPKSLDRNDFKVFVAEYAGLAARSTEDGAATLTALSAATVAAALPLLPQRPQSVVAAGGGAHNPTLLAMLADRLGVPVTPADALGLSSDAMEAQAFAFLAVRALRGLPLSFPTTTGVPAPMAGGVAVALD